MRAGSIHLPQIGLWCDAHTRQDCSFVSHAHFDHLARHRRVITSPGTQRLMRERMPGKREEVVLPFGELHPFDAETELRLHPAGHIFGSAMLHLVRPGGSFLYTGDFKLRPGRSAEACVPPRADILVMETTFGLPRYVMPPTETVLAAIIAFCRETLADGAVPILYGYSLGKSQELLCALTDAALPVMLHEATMKMTKVYEEMGQSFPTCRRFKLSKVAGHVVMCPPQSRKSEWLLKIEPRRTAMATGWAVDSSAIYRYGCDAVFPLSDHADYPDLLRLVDLVQPKRVYTVHGYAREFAQDLRARGVEAWALGMENQLEFPLKNLVPEHKPLHSPP